LFHFIFRTEWVRSQDFSKQPVFIFFVLKINLLKQNYNEKNRRVQMSLQLNIGDINKPFGEKLGRYIRKYISARIAPYCVLNEVRIYLYRLCGYRIGRNCFIGMRCYLDDIEPKMFTVEDNVTISYGCFFACHGKNQQHMPITIKQGVYLGMRSNVISGKNGVTIGEYAIIGACSLVISDIPAHSSAVGVPARIIVSS
jgi:acetyltransferase-like isoleucine patch superfamily enzyme